MAITTKRKPGRKRNPLGYPSESLSFKCPIVILDRVRALADLEERSVSITTARLLKLALDTKDEQKKKQSAGVTA